MASKSSCVVDPKRKYKSQTCAATNNKSAIDHFVIICLVESEKIAICRHRHCTSLPQKKFWCYKFSG